MLISVLSLGTLRYCSLLCSSQSEAQVLSSSWLSLLFATEFLPSVLVIVLFLRALVNCSLFRTSTPELHLPWSPRVLPLLAPVFLRHQLIRSPNQYVCRSLQSGKTLGSGGPATDRGGRKRQCRSMTGKQQRSTSRARAVFFLLFSFLYFPCFTHQPWLLVETSNFAAALRARTRLSLCYCKPSLSCSSSSAPTLPRDQSIFEIPQGPPPPPQRLR